VIKGLFISLTCALASWSSAQACSIMPPKVDRENTYEQNLEPYFTNIHRNMVDEADNIVVGKFEYSKTKKKHILNISESLKRPKATWASRKTEVAFNQIDDDRVEYEKRNPSDTDYLIFANKDFEVSSMLLLRQSKMLYKSAIENLIENPLDKYGISFNLKGMLDRGSNIQLLETAQCLPSPTYTIVKSSKSENEGKIFEAEPIRIFNSNEERYQHKLSDLEKRTATNKGMEEGLYTNAPSVKECRIGKKYLMLGQFLYSRNGSYSGQMIAENNGYFQLNNTAYEHHISPELISYDTVEDILNRQSLK